MALRYRPVNVVIERLYDPLFSNNNNNNKSLPYEIIYTFHYLLPDTISLN